MSAPTATLHAVTEPKTARRQRLETLLEHWDEIWDPHAGLQDQAGDGTGTQQMPKWIHDQSIQEIDRCLRLLPTQERAHLKAYYLAETRIVIHRTRIKIRRGVYTTKPQPRIERILPTWINLTRKDNALALLELMIQGPIEIPNELRRALDAIPA